MLSFSSTRRNARRSVGSKTNAINCQELENPVIDATGRVVLPGANYVWTKASLDASYCAAFASGFIPDTTYLGMRSVPGRPGLHAIGYHIPTGAIRAYAMNAETARPYLIADGDPEQR